MWRLELTEHFIQLLWLGFGLGAPGLLHYGGNRKRQAMHMLSPVISCGKFKALFS